MLNQKIFHISKQQYFSTAIDSNAPASLLSKRFLNPYIAHTFSYRQIPLDFSTPLRSAQNDTQMRDCFVASLRMTNGATLPESPPGHLRFAVPVS